MLWHAQRVCHTAMEPEPAAPAAISEYDMIMMSITSCLVMSASAARDRYNLGESYLEHCFAKIDEAIHHLSAVASTPEELYGVQCFIVSMLVTNTSFCPSLEAEHCAKGVLDAVMSLTSAPAE